MENAAASDRLKHERRSDLMGDRIRIGRLKVWKEGERASWMRNQSGNFLLTPLLN